MVHNTMNINWDDPVERAALVERLGIKAYNAAQAGIAHMHTLKLATRPSLCWTLTIWIGGKFMSAGSNQMSVCTTLLTKLESGRQPDRKMPKRGCTLTEPPMRVNGEVIPGRRKPVSRKEAAQYLKSCRNGKASVLCLNAGLYTILPHGLQYGFKLQTR